MQILLTITQILAIFLIIFWGYFFFETPTTSAAQLYGAAMCATGIIFGIALVANNLKTQNGRINALKREEEKKSISSTESKAKVKVLEAKIQTLEKALESALKNK